MKSEKAAKPGSILLELKYEPDILPEKLLEVYYKYSLEGDDISNDQKIKYLTSIYKKINKMTLDI